MNNGATEYYSSAQTRQDSKLNLLVWGLCDPVAGNETSRVHIHNQPTIQTTNNALGGGGLKERVEHNLLKYILVLIFFNLILFAGSHFNKLSEIVHGFLME